jgi:hypothetical protein
VDVVCWSSTGATNPATPAPSGDAGGVFSALMAPQPFDEGGWLQPGQSGINTGSRPELVLSPQQPDAATSGSGGRGQPSVVVHNITAVDADDVAKQIAARQRLAAMQYNSRP